MAAAATLHGPMQRCIQLLLLELQCDQRGTACCQSPADGNDSSQLPGAAVAAARHLIPWLLLTLSWHMQGLIRRQSTARCLVVHNGNEGPAEMLA